MKIFTFLIAFALVGCSSEKSADNKTKKQNKVTAAPNPEPAVGDNSSNSDNAIGSAQLDMCAPSACTNTSTALYTCSVNVQGKNYFTQAPSLRCDAETTLKQHLCQLNGGQYKNLSAADSATFKCNETTVPNEIKVGAFLKCDGALLNRFCTADVNPSKCTVSYQGKIFNSQGSNLCAAQRALDQTLCNDGLGQYISEASYKSTQCQAE